MPARQATEKLIAKFRDSDEQLASDLSAAQVLQDISSRLILEGDAGQSYEDIVDAAMGIMRSDMASLHIVDEREDALRMLSSRGFGPAFDRTFESNRADATPHAVPGAWAIVSSYLTWRPVTSSSVRWHWRTIAGRASGRCNPRRSSRVAGKMLGTISTCWRQSHHPSDHALDLMDILARLAADLHRAPRFPRRDRA